MKLQFDHLDDKKIGYFEHANGAFKIAGSLFVASIKTTIHAIMPDTFKSCATECAQNILNMTSASDKDKNE